MPEDILTETSINTPIIMNKHVGTKSRIFKLFIPELDVNTSVSMPSLIPSSQIEFINEILENQGNTTPELNVTDIVSPINITDIISTCYKLPRVDSTLISTTIPRSVDYVTDYTTT